MLCIYNKNTDPHYNLAAEEYLIRENDSDVFMLWRNANAIIVGKHQNTLAEINYEFVREKGIKVVRRLSGGGTVFHDLGNINFTFIKQGDGMNLVDFRKFTQPIIEFLATLGIEAKFEGRNDLTIDGKKFSGNAEHVYRDRILHHGTILFSSKMSDLSAALKVNPEKFKDKAVKSVRSRVTNISDHLREKISIEDFIRQLMDYVTATRDDSREYELTAEDDKKIKDLVTKKYGTWDWNFGYSPKYDFNRSFKTQGGHIEVKFDVKDGVIRNAKLHGDYFHVRDSDELEEMLKGLQHDYNIIRQRLEKENIGNYIQGCTLEEFMDGIF